MNTRFFDVKKAKQDAVINAALKIFALNGYKNASTDVIVKEAGISKGLLFHYFGSKQGLYEFIYDYSVKYMTLELTRTVSKTEKDFFAVQVQLTRAKTRVMKNYPYMEQFINNSRLETDPEAVACIGELKDVMKETYNNIYSQTDNTRFMDRLDIGDVINMITWMSDGFIRDKFRSGDFNLDDMNEEFEKFLNLLRRHFYRSPGNDLISMAREEMVERNEDVMDEMRLKAVYEEKRKAMSTSAPIFAADTSADAETADNEKSAAKTSEIQAEKVAEPSVETPVEETADGVQYIKMSTDYDAERRSEQSEDTSDDALEAIINEQDKTADAEETKKAETEDNEANDIETADSKTSDEESGEDKTESVPQQRVYVEKQDMSLFPDWWRQADPEPEETESSETVAEAQPEIYAEQEAYTAQELYTEPQTYAEQPVYAEPQMYAEQPVYAEPQMYAEQPMYAEPQVYADQQTYAEPQVYADQQVYAEPQMYAEQQPYYGTEAGQSYEYTGPLGNIPTISNDSFVPDFNVPEDLLHSTLKNLADGEEADDDDEAWSPRPVRQIRL